MDKKKDFVFDLLIKVFPVRNWNDRSEDDQKLTRLGMKMGTIGVFACLFFFFYFLILGLQDLAIAISFGAAVMTGNIFLSRSNINNVPPLLGVLVFVIIIFYGKIVYPNLTFEFVLLIISVPITVGFKDARFILPIFFVVTCLFFLLSYLGHILPVTIPLTVLQINLTHYIIIALIFIVSYTAISNSNKEERIIIDELRFQKKVINEQNAKMIQLKEEQHQLEISNKEKDVELLIANNTMKLAARKKVLDQLTALSRSDNLKKDLKMILAELKQQSDFDQKINHLQENIYEINTAFFRKLKAAYPKITKTEREVCSYIKLGMSTKEIAYLRGSKTNTIDVTKSRIRTKMELPPYTKIIDELEKL